MQLQYETNLIREPEFSSIHAQTNYIRALNWALPTLVVVVIGDVIPINVPETIYVVVLMLSALIVNALIIGSISDIIADVNARREIIARRKLSCFLMDHHGVPRDLRGRVHDYFKSIWASSAGVKTSSALGYLPPALARKSREYFVNKHLPNLALLFSGCESAVLTRLLGSLQPRHYAEGDYVIQCDEPSRSVHFLAEGFFT